MKKIYRDAKGRFCKRHNSVENVAYRQTPEARAKQKAHREKPENKAREKARRQTPEYKAWHKAHNQTPEAKAYQKAYRQKPEVKAKRETPEFKAKEKARRETPEAKAKEKARKQTAEYKATEKAYKQKPEVKAKEKVRHQVARKTPEYKAWLKEHEQTEKRKTDRRVNGATKRAKYLKRKIPLDEAGRKAVFEIYANRPDDWHVDHIVPLLGETISGLHHPDNLQYLPEWANYMKGNRWEDSWAEHTIDTPLEEKIKDYQLNYEGGKWHE